MVGVSKTKQQEKIVGIGACVKDTLIMIPEYPKEDTKVRALSYRIAGGGPAATESLQLPAWEYHLATLEFLHRMMRGNFLKMIFSNMGWTLHILK